MAPRFRNGTFSTRSIRAALGLAAIGLLALLCAGNAGAQEAKRVHRLDIKEIERTPAFRLGERLFVDSRLSNPGSQFLASCRSCHLPENAPEGRRAYTDRIPRSLLPATTRGPKRLTLRNTSSLYDVGRMTRLNRDGQYGSLTSLIKAKLAGLHMGWLPGEQDQAHEALRALLMHDIGEDAIAEGSYVEQFKAVRNVDLASLSRDEVIGQVVDVLALYVGQLGVRQTAPYDAFAYLNRLNTEILVDEGDTPDAFSGRIFGRLGNQEGRVLVKFLQGFDEPAYQGFKIFMRTYDIDYDDRIGNCVSCHPPPYFTDDLFHNTGAAQDEYDSLHGEGAFARLEIPGPKAQRPDAQYRSRPEKDKPGHADLGYWNFVNLKTEPRLTEGESGEALLDRMAGAFKTPGLRNPDYSAPYMHNGAYATLEDAIAHKIRISQLAKEGKLANPDPQYLRMNLNKDDIAPLAAFLRSLNEVPAEDFRNLVLEDVVIRGAAPPATPSQNKP